MNPVNFINLENSELTKLFFAIVLLLSSSHFLGYVLEKIKVSKVIGEIIGGLILGPTILGFISPDIYTWIFNGFESEGKILSSVSWFGLIFLMFISGFEIQTSYKAEDKKIIFAILIGSTLIPFFAGWLAPSFYDFSRFIGGKNNFNSFRIIIAIAVAVTSIPVISKIFLELNMMKTRFAKIVLATATIHDVILWSALAIATGLIASTNTSSLNIVYSVLITVVFFILSLYLMPKIFIKINKSRFNLLLKSSESGYGLFLCFLFVLIASILNVNIVFGALLGGILIGILPSDKFKDFKSHIKNIAFAFFIPIYFAIVGLKLDLIHHFDILFFILFFIFSTFFEFLGTFLFSKLFKLDNLTSFNFSVAMNTRGGPGIVLATVAYDLDIINQNFFVILVLNAIVTSLIASVWFRYVKSKDLRLMNL